MTAEYSEALLSILRALAPGMPLRDAIERIIQQDSGALIVLGAGPTVTAISTGGFLLDGTPFTAQRLAELAKMDGGIVIDKHARIIHRANVHFQPDSTIATDETGARHRTAERIARQTGCAVISVSEGRRVATIFHDGGKHELESPTRLVARANEALTTMERFRRRLDESEEGLTRAEVDDTVTYREVAGLLQRADLVRRIGQEIHNYAVELGGEGGLIRVQLADLLQGAVDLRNLVVRDYVSTRRTGAADRAIANLEGLTTQDLYDSARVVGALGISDIEGETRPRGYRVLEQVARLPEPVKEALIGHFGDFQKMLWAPAEELDDVEGVGRTRALQLRHYFDRLIESGRVWNVRNP